MDFGYNPQEKQFREEVTEFISQEFPAELRWNFASTATPAILSYEGKDLEFIKTMRKKVGAKGWLTLNWPEEYGGRNSYTLQNIVFEEMLYYNVPAFDPIGLTFFAPTLIKFGTTEQKKRYLPAIARGESSWCELLSEPDAGSDLAAVKTIAVKEGNDYIINGQKIWNSGAHQADMGFILVRTDATQARHRGLSYFLLDMKSPGITIRPLVNMAGEHDFNEVFLDSVRVPAGNMVGEPNKGWYVTMMTLDYERYAHMLYASVKGYLDRLVAYVKNHGHVLDQVERNAYAQLLAECEMARLIHYRAMDILSKGTPSTYEVAMDKMYNCELAQRAADFGMQLLGAYGGLSKNSKNAPLQGYPSFYFLDTPSFTMMGGTSEIDRNVIATQGLGLPNQ